MKYQIKKLKVNDFSVYEENRLPFRSYFIPYVSAADFENTDAITERYSSNMVKVLSGDWLFRYYGKISRLPSNFDSEKTAMDSVCVPSTWQRTGYEPPCYLNTRYQFPMTLPDVPEEMSAGIYVKKFELSPQAENPIITFLGVCSSLTLYVNGRYVGYSEGSHNSAEFDLKDYVRQGENELLAIVSKWCNGTYLECQDMFRENGIFRDVYITENPKQYIYDVAVKTSKQGESYKLSAELTVKGSELEGKTAVAELFYKGESIARVSAELENELKLELEGLDVTEWNAEKPELYELFISVLDGEQSLQCVRQRVGFRTVEIKGEQFLFNGRLIKFKGVNHHDSHHTGGYVMTGEQLLRDVELMKSFNVNAVRMSHYPPDPMLIQLCDEKGLYVIDEADIETHGTQYHTDMKPTLKPNIISNDKQWLGRMLDRVTALYQRDKNHACVTMWSLGNESGGWKNQDRCYEYLKSVSELPVHYEAVIRTPRVGYDVISEMYQHPEIVNKIGEHKFLARYKGKPYFLCEYCHAMGVGPGSLEDYWKIIYAHDNLTGGCIWEWSDHSVYNSSGKYKYTYGGDHGEKYHDGNFCVDGLFFPDRTPHTGAYNMKAVYRPIRIEWVSDNLYRFINTNAFTDSSAYKLSYELFRNGISVEKGTVEPELEPLSAKNMVIAHRMTDTEADWHINFLCTDSEGREISLEQHELNSHIETPEINEQAKVSLISKNDTITVTFDKGSAVFSKKEGTLLKLTYGSKQLLYNEQALKAQIYRAFLDNDRNIVNTWNRLGYNKLEYQGKLVSQKLKDSYAELESEGWLYAEGKKLFECEFKYKLYPDGTIKVKVELEKRLLDLTKHSLPRFGVNMLLDKSLCKVKYYGMGPGENLPDFNAHSYVGIFESDVKGMCVDYIKPQDSGNHGESRWVELTDSEGRGIRITNKDAHFSFSVHDYPESQVRQAKHQEDIKRGHLTSLSIDGFMRGTGSNSCGPNTLSKYCISFRKELEFSFYITPVFDEKAQ